MLTWHWHRYFPAPGALTELYSVEESWQYWFSSRVWSVRYTWLLLDPPIFIHILPGLHTASKNQTVQLKSLWNDGCFSGLVRLEGVGRERRKGCWFASGYLACLVIENWKAEQVLPWFTHCAFSSITCFWNAESSFVWCKCMGLLEARPLCCCGFSTSSWSVIY